MAHVKRFEEFRAEKNSTNESVNELFKSKEKAAQKEKAKKELMAKLDEYEKKGYDVRREELVKKAEDNKFRGELVPVKSKKSGKVVVIYKDGLTKLQKVASGTGALTKGESVEENSDMDMDSDMDSDMDIDPDMDMEEDEDVNETEDFEEMDCDEYEEGMYDEEEVDESHDDEDEDCDEDEDINEAKDLAVAKEEFEKQLDELEEKGYVVNRKVLMEQAEENKFRGNFKPVKSKKSGKVVVIYQKGLTKLQKLGQSAGSFNRGRGM